jgi:hypothetical protein
MRSLLIQFNAAPPSELFRNVRGGAERLQRLQEFYAPLKNWLRFQLRDYPVEVNDLEAIGAVVVTGSAGTLDGLTRPGGALDSSDISVAENVDFLPLPEFARR